jgi:hypothetical protein
MTVNALALFVRAATLRQPGKAGHNTPSTQDSRIASIRARAGLCRSYLDDLDMAENDYYRFRQAPRD